MTTKEKEEIWAAVYRVAVSGDDTYDQFMESVESLINRYKSPQNTCEDCGCECLELTDVSGLLVGDCCLNAYTLG